MARPRGEIKARMPLIVETIRLAERSGRPLTEVSLNAGYGHNALHQMRTGTVPSVMMVDDVLRAVGYRLAIVRDDG